MTYTALATLLILGDDLSRVNHKAVLSGVAKLQQPDGRWFPAHTYTSPILFLLLLPITPLPPPPPPLPVSSPRPMGVRTT